MKAALALALLTVTVAYAQQRSDFVSDASYVLATHEPASRAHTPVAMAEAAERFLEGLDDSLRARAVHALDSPERRAWTNLPAAQDAGGVRFGELNEDQVRAVCDLMATLFSPQGYDKMRQIMLADDQLLRGGQARAGFGTESFAVVVFGTPSATDPWAFQLDGHHVGVNIAVQGERLTMSPSFIGTQPESFQIGTTAYRPLADEIDVAFELVNRLSETQLEAAVLGGQRGRITTGPGTDGQVPTVQGTRCGDFDNAQRELLLKLIAQWVHDMPPRHAERRMQQIAAELDETYFAWQGPRQPISDVSYRIQGPSILIEYACQDLGGNPLNHLHTMYRDPTNEYGGQLESN